MQRDEDPPRPDLSGSETAFSPSRAVVALAGEVARLDPGPAAELRRGPFEGAGAVAFWNLMTRHGPDQPGDKVEARWAAIIQAIAILTPKGRSPEKVSAHDPTRPMGAALHDAGISELRLARLLAAPRPMRGSLTVRLCRRLAASERCRFDLRTLAQFILFGGDRTDRRISRDYYCAEAKAERASNEKRISSDD